MEIETSEHPFGGGEGSRVDFFIGEENKEIGLGSSTMTRFSFNTSWSNGFQHLPGFKNKRDMREIILNSEPITEQHEYAISLLSQPVTAVLAD